MLVTFVFSSYEGGNDDDSIQLIDSKCRGAVVSLESKTTKRTGLRTSIGPEADRNILDVHTKRRPPNFPWPKMGILINVKDSPAFPPNHLHSPGGNFFCA